MNITDSIKHFAQSTPDTVALLYSDETITYAQLERKVKQGVHFFTQAGVQPSQVIALVLEDELLIALSMLALARMGCTVITLESSMSSVMLEEVTTQADVDIFVTSTSSKQAFTLPIYKVEASSFEGDAKIDDDFYLESPKSPWLYILGSGTTGKSKIIPITHEQMLSRVSLDGQVLGINSDDIVASCMSLHFFVPKLRLFDALVCGGAYVLLHRKEQALMGMVQKFEITVLYGAVLHMENFLKSRIDNKQELLKSLKVLAVSSSTVSEDLRQRIQTQLTPNLYVMYGCNEVSPVSVLSAKEKRTRALSIGQVVKDVEVEVIDQQGKAVPFSEVGQLRVKSPALIDAYVNDETATNKNFKEGWFYPGDLVSLHEDGELCYHGRSDHMMIMNGINIYPSHIESVLSHHPVISDIAVVPMQHKVHQDIPVCAVVIEEGKSVALKHLMDYAKAHLGVQAPREIVVLESIPRNVQGKLERNVLKKLLEQALDQRYTERSQTVLVMFSGGIDSTYMLYHYLMHTEYKVHVHHISMRYPSEPRWQEEDVATRNIIKLAKKIRPFHYSESRVDFGFYKYVGRDSDTQLLMASKVAPNIKGKVSLALGWLYSDYLDDIENGRAENKVSEKLWDALCNSMDHKYGEHVSREILLPLVEMKLNKKELIEQLPHEFLKLTWSCRKPQKGENGTSVPCGKCHPCRSIKEVLESKKS